MPHSTENTAGRFKAQYFSPRSGDVTNLIELDATSPDGVAMNRLRIRGDEIEDVLYVLNRIQQHRKSGG